MVIQHNLQALNANRMVSIVGKVSSKSIEKLSSGYKINRSADNAAGLGISEKMRFQIRGLNRGAANISDGISYCQTADGALNEVHDMIQRMNELCVQAANGTNSNTDREYINMEISEIKTELDRVFQTTKFNDDYIFKCEDNKSLSHEVYNLKFSGMITDFAIYNETCDTTPGNVSATYGGIVYKGKRIAWNSLGQGMYNPSTGKFVKGEYNARMDDGTNLTLICEDGDEPPKMKMQGMIVADKTGVTINGQTVSWNDIKDRHGKAINKNNIDEREFTINAGGLKVKFTTEFGESFEDVMSKLSGCMWQSEFEIPREDKAVFADFSQSEEYLKNNSIVGEYVKTGNTALEAFTFRADDTGVWMENKDGVVANSHVMWEDMGFTSWGDGSTDINKDFTYTYKADISTAQDGSDIKQFTFYVKDEISKDSLIAAIDGCSIKGYGITETEGKGEFTYTKDSLGYITGMKVTFNLINPDMKDEYNLGRDFGNMDAYQDEKLIYDQDENKLKAIYTNTRDGNTVTKTYETENLDAYVDEIKSEIKNRLNLYDMRILSRYAAGAINPNSFDLAALLDNKLTGAGTSTYFQDVFRIDKFDSNMHTSDDVHGDNYYAGACIDFSGLGVDYTLADLIGMGFNSTCETCDRHYSVEFISKATSGIDGSMWSSKMIEGSEIEYSMKKYGNDNTLYLDVDSMKSTIHDGIQLSNAIVDLVSGGAFDFHYTQYAARIDDSKLYIFDNRPEYAKGGVSAATAATFEPFSYTFNTYGDLSFNIADTSDSLARAVIEYGYDFNVLIGQDIESRIIKDDDPDGKYVIVGGIYELYDPAKPEHVGLQRCNVIGISAAVSDDDIEYFVKEKLLSEIADSTRMKLKPLNYATIEMSGEMDDTDNVLMVTDGKQPEQVIKVKKPMRPEEDLYLKIQCSSNTIDMLDIDKYRLSVFRLGLENLNTLSENAATRGITQIDKALQRISKIRSSYGAFQNRLEHSYNSNNNTAENTQAAESALRDTDMDKEMVINANTNILLQAGQTMLAQANQAGNAVLSLIK